MVAQRQAVQGLQGGKDPHGLLRCARSNTSASSGGSALGPITAPGKLNHPVPTAIIVWNAYTRILIDAPPGIQPSNNQASQDMGPQRSPNQAATAATEMHKFVEFPGEIRDMVWELAIADSKNAASAQAQHGIRDVDIAELDLVCLQKQGLRLGSMSAPSRPSLRMFCVSMLREHPAAAKMASDKECLLGELERVSRPLPCL